MALHPPLQARELPSALSGTYKVIRRLNRNTTWVATGLLGSVAFAALMVTLQERHAKVDDLAEARPTTDGPSANANQAAISDIVGSNQKSTGEILSGEATSVGPGFTPEISRSAGQANGASRSPTQQPDSARVIGSRIPNVRHRTFVRHRIVDVKTRLIALWHQSLARSEKSRAWTTFSNWNRGDRKKVSYTAETNH